MSEEKKNTEAEEPKEETAKVEVKVPPKADQPQPKADGHTAERKQAPKEEAPPKADQPTAEKEEAPKEEVKPEAPKEETKAEKKTEEPKAEAPKEEAAKPETGEGKEKKRKKINLMSLKEIEAKLKSVKEKMGNLKSRYAQQLFKQKDILSK